MQQDCQLSPTRLIKLRVEKQKLCKNEKAAQRGRLLAKRRRGKGKSLREGDAR
jgi:hypothetical protein